MIWVILAVVFVVGCLGGVLNSLIAGEMVLPGRDEETKVYRPGWIGTMVVGGFAALVIWGLYGPLSTALLIFAKGNPAGSVQPAAALSVAETLGAVVTGIGGGRILTNEVQKKIADARRLGATAGRSQRPAPRR
jgi:hypothetical protein